LIVNKSCKANLITFNFKHKEAEKEVKYGEYITGEVQLLKGKPHANKKVPNKVRDSIIEQNGLQKNKYSL